LQIQNKLFLTLLTTSILAVAILVGLMQWSVGRGMVDYINQREANKIQPMISDIAKQYGQTESWRWLQSKPRVLRKLMFENLLLRRDDKHCDHDDEDCREMKSSHRPKEFMSSYSRRPDLAILDANGHTVVAINARSKHRSKIAIEWQGNVVGWVSIPDREKISEGFELLFIEQQQKAFWLMALIVIVLAGIIAFPLARHFVRPIKQLTQGTNQLIQGKYELQLSIDRNDELGILARDFNELAQTLDKNEGARRRWVADISHELRTPLAILSGEVEAMLDGVRPLSKDGIQSMQEEVSQLSQLVNDLYALTQADIGGLSYRKQDIDLAELLRSKLKSFEPLFNQYHQIIQCNNTDTPINIWADSTRLNQLLDNLFTNANRYTDNGGKIHISIEQNKSSTSLIIEDSDPGVTDEALTHLFDHLYRTEQSRNRNSGGSGLGLAICKRIVEGHGGTMTAAHSTLGGVAIQIQLPVGK